MEVQINYKNGDKICIGNVISFYDRNVLNLGDTIDVVRSIDDGKRETLSFTFENINAFHVIDYK